MKATLFVAAGLLGFAWFFGWFTGPRPWRVATGWERLPVAGQAPLLRRLGGDAGPEVAWLGHSGFVLRWNGVTLLLDPNIAGHVSIARRILEIPDLPAPVDGVLLSHAHYDHMNKPTLARIAQAVPIVVPAGSEEYLPGRRIMPLAVGAATNIGGVEIVAVPAAHNGARNHPWRSDKIALGYILRANGYSVYFAGDTSFANDFAGIRETYRPDAAILPIGCFAPRIPFKIHHISPEEAVKAAQALGVSVAVPCHFGTYRLTGDHPATALPRFARAANAAGLAWVMPTLEGAAP